MKLNSFVKYGAVAAAVAASCGVANAATVASVAGAATFSAQGNATSGGDITIANFNSTLAAAYVANDTVTVTIGGGGTLGTFTPATVNCSDGVSTDKVVLAYLSKTTTAVTYRVQSVNAATAGSVCTFTGYKLLASSVASAGNITAAYGASTFGSNIAFDAGAAANIATVASQFSNSAVTALNGVVDVNASRLSYEAADGTAVAGIARGDVLSFTTNNLSGSQSNPAVVTSIVTTINGDFSFVDDDGTAGCNNADLAANDGVIAVGAGGGTLSINAACTVLTHTVTGPAAGATAHTIGFGKATHPAAAAGKALTAPQTFTASTSYNYNAGATSTSVSLTPGSWTLNGFSAVIPYMPYGGDATQAIYLTNRSSQTGAVTATAVNEAGTACASFPVATATANAVTNLSAGLRSGIAACYPDYTGKVAITLTANVPAATATVYSAFNIGGNSRVTVVNDSNGK